MSFEGFDELSRLLRELPKAAMQRAFRPAARSGARYMANRTKAATPRGPSGNLYGAAGYVRQSRDPGPFGVAFSIGYRSPRGAHAIIVAKGSQTRRTRRGANRGRMPARNFFDPAIEAASRGAALLIRHQLAIKIAVEARRLASGQLDSRGRLRKR